MYTISHFFANRIYDEATLKYFMYEIARHGAEHLVITNPWCVKYIEDPTFIDVLKRCCESSGITFAGCHAPFGIGWDLDTWDAERRPAMLEEQSRCIAFAAEFGVKTMTFHPGAMPPDYTLPQLRDLIRASLEYLLPYAEKYGVIMCIENAMRPTNTPDELLRYLKEFDTPWLGCTYDTGHANVMSSFNGTKDPAKYSEKFLAIWPDGVVFEDHAVDKLAPYVVVSHVHNNNGYKDEHRFIDDGALDWKPIIRKLKYDCPRIQNIENETKVFEHLISMTRIGQDFAKLIAEA